MKYGLTGRNKSIARPAPICQAQVQPGVRQQTIVQTGDGWKVDENLLWEGNSKVAGKSKLGEKSKLGRKSNLGGKKMGGK